METTIIYWGYIGIMKKKDGKYYSKIGLAPDADLVAALGTCYSLSCASASAGLRPATIRHGNFYTSVHGASRGWLQTPPKQHGRRANRSGLLSSASSLPELEELVPAALPHHNHRGIWS